jgi:hypothetical protein
MGSQPEQLPGSPWRRAVHAYLNDCGPVQRSALLSWTAFTGTFAVVRGVTHAIRRGVGPFENLTLGREHIHHYLWGIAMVTAAGGVAVRGQELSRRQPVVSLVYGAGLALIVDELALLLDLQDVYWTRQGRESVDAAVILIAGAGTYFAAIPFWHRVFTGRRSPLSAR